MTAQLDSFTSRPSLFIKKRAPSIFFEEPKAETIKDRQQRAVAALLTRFKYLVDLAATPAEDGATKEVAAANAFRMEVESSALVYPAESYPLVIADSRPGSRRRGSTAIDKGAQGDVAFWSIKRHWRRRGRREDG
jgi:hypothetical protein